MLCDVFNQLNVIVFHTTIDRQRATTCERSAHENVLLAPTLVVNSRA